ncbi:MAG: hypothetical protein Q9221_005491 [Calogaya cf. arnoldii]
MPRFDLSQLGRIAFTGNFFGLSLYQEWDQSMRFRADDGEFTIGGQALGGMAISLQLPNGDFLSLGIANNYVRQVGNLRLPDGTLAGIVVVGNFTRVIDSINMTEIYAQGVVKMDFTTGEYTPLPGLRGTINSLLTDGDSFYVGGDFKAANSTNALFWNGNSGWEDLPFHGFNGEVNSIAKLSDGSIAFGGSFSRVARDNYTVYPDEPSGNLSTMFGVSPRTSNITRLSGLFGFNPTGDDNSGRPAAISRVQLNPGATVLDLVSYKDSLFVAGSFRGRGISNIFMIQDDMPVALAGGGLNDAVTQLHLEQHMLYVGGNFNGTAHSTNTTTGLLSNVAVFSILDQHWEALGAGVDGPISNLNPLKVNITPGSPPETVIVVNGNFGQLLAFDNNPAVEMGDKVGGLGIWVPSAKNWLQNLPIDQQAYSGYLTSCNSEDNGLAQTDDPICVGTLSTFGLRASLACGLRAFGESNDTDLSTFNLKAMSGNGSGTATGIFHEHNGLNLTILAGQFTAVASDGSIVRNLAFINSTDTEVVSGLEIDFGHDSIIQSLATKKDVLYAGGILSGSLKKQGVNGLIAYDLKGNDFSLSQPPPLIGRTVQIKAMQFKPANGPLYVGGSFEGAGSIECPGVCVYDDLLQRWSRPGSGLGGSVTHLIWTDQETLVAAGNIVIEGEQYSLATFYVPNGRWAPFREDQSIPGEITAMSPADGLSARASTTSDWTSDSTSFWIAGVYPNSTAFLTKWDGTSWKLSGPIFGTPSRITSIQTIHAEGATRKNTVLEEDQILFLTGNMVMSDTGNASAIIYNKTSARALISTIDGGGNPGMLTQMMFSKSYVEYRPTSDAKGLVIAIAVAVIAVLISIIVIGEVGEICHRRWIHKKSYRLLSHQSKSSKK